MSNKNTPWKLGDQIDMSKAHDSLTKKELFREATKAQHAPGPYLMKMTSSGAEQTGLIFGGEDGTEQICNTGIDYWYNRRAEGVSSAICNPEIERCKANARLIAAAPELLEALKEALLIVETQMGMDAVSSPIWHKGMAAIAKAEGE